MKKSAKIASGIVAVLIACPALTWYSGKFIETRITEMRQSMERELLDGLGEEATEKLKKFAKITDYEYTRGFASSTYSFVLEISSQDKNVRIKYTSQIKHGPFVGFCFGMGSSEEEWALLDAPKEITDMLGGDKLMTARNVFSLSGYTNTAQIPDIDRKIPDDSDPLHIVLKGMKSNVYSTYDLRKSSGDVFVKEFSLSNKKINIKADGLSVKINNNLLDNAEKSCGFLTCLNIGTQEMRVNHLSVKDGTEQELFVLEKLAYDQDWSKKGNFLDLMLRAGAKSLQVKNDKDSDTPLREFGPAQYEVSFRHLQTESLIKVNDAYMRSYLLMLPAILSADKHKVELETERMMGNMALLAVPGIEILKQSPEIRLDRINFMTPQGEVKLKASVTIKDFKESDFIQQNELIRKIAAEFEASAPAGWVKQFASHSGLEMGKKEGYISEKKEVLSTKVIFKNGELNLNGKPVSIPVAGAFFSGLMEHNGDGEEYLPEESDESTE